MLEQMCGSWTSARLLCNRRPLARSGWASARQRGTTEATGFQTGRPRRGQPEPVANKVQSRLSAVCSALAGLLVKFPTLERD